MTEYVYVCVLLKRTCLPDLLQYSTQTTCDWDWNRHSWFGNVPLFVQLDSIVVFVPISSLSFLCLWSCLLERSVFLFECKRRTDGNTKE